MEYAGSFILTLFGSETRYVPGPGVCGIWWKDDQNIGVLVSGGHDDDGKWWMWWSDDGSGSHNVLVDNGDEIIHGENYMH